MTTDLSATRPDRFALLLLQDTLLIVAMVKYRNAKAVRRRYEKALKAKANA